MAQVHGKSGQYGKSEALKRGKRIFVTALLSTTGGGIILGVKEAVARCVKCLEMLRQSSADVYKRPIEQPAMAQSID
jgi:hypothetical protein